MKKYIITIYRVEKDKPRSIVGVVEEVGMNGKKAFNTYDELWEVLNPKSDCFIEGKIEEINKKRR
jgi:hypothetical protein